MADTTFTDGVTRIVSAWLQDVNSAVYRASSGIPGVTTNRTALARAVDFPSVKDFGAVGDGVTDDTTAWNTAQTNADFIWVPPGTYLLNNFRPQNRKRFLGAGYLSVTIQQAAAGTPAINCLSDATTGQLANLEFSGFTLKGAAAATVPALVVQATNPYVVKNSKFDFVADSCFNSLKIVTTTSNEVYDNEFKVHQLSSLSTGVLTTGGVYNKFDLFIVGSANGIAINDSSWSAVFVRAVSDGQQIYSGQQNVVLSPTVEGWTGTAQGSAIAALGFNNRFVAAAVVNVPNAKAPFALGLNGGGGNTNTWLGVRVVGTAPGTSPNSPVDIPAGNKGTFVDFVTDSTALLESYLGASILNNFQFVGNCSTLTAQYSRDFSASTTYDPPNLTAGTGATTTVALTGAAIGDYVLPSFSLDLQGITLTGYVSAAGTVSVRFQNGTAGAIDLASGTLKVKVIKI